MEDGYGEVVAHHSVRDCLLIADYFGAQRPAPIKLAAPLEVLVREPLGHEEVWVLKAFRDRVKTYSFEGMGYWVRETVVTTREQKDILCTLGFAAESGRFLKFLHQSSTVLMSLELVHLLYLDEVTAG